MDGKIILVMLLFAGVLDARVSLAQPAAAPPNVARLLVGVWRAVPGGMYTEDADGKKILILLARTL